MFGTSVHRSSITTYGLRAGNPISNSVNAKNAIFISLPPRRRQDESLPERGYWQSHLPPEIRFQNCRHGMFCRQRNLGRLQTWFAYHEELGLPRDPWMRREACPCGEQLRRMPIKDHSS
jgi:hypothetical protein